MGIDLKVIDEDGKLVKDELIDKINKKHKNSIDLTNIVIGGEIPIFESNARGEGNTLIASYIIVNITNPILISNRQSKQYDYANPQGTIAYIRKVGEGYCKNIRDI